MYSLTCLDRNQTTVFNGITHYVTCWIRYFDTRKQAKLYVKATMASNTKLSKWTKEKKDDGTIVRIADDSGYRYFIKKVKLEE